MYAFISGLVVYDLCLVSCCGFIGLISCLQLPNVNTVLLWGWRLGLRLVRGQLCWVGNGAVWEMENREAEQEKMSEKGLQKAYKHSLQPHDLALLWAPEFGNSSETKTEEWGGKQKEEKKDGIKNIYKGVIPHRIFFCCWLWNLSLDTTMGPIEQLRSGESKRASKLAPVQGTGFY